MISLNENDKFTKNEIMDTENNREMLKPNSIHFNTVMAAYNKHRVKGAAKKVQSLLVQMEKLYEAGNDKLKPDMKVSINSIFLVLNLEYSLVSIVTPIGYFFF